MDLERTKDGVALYGERDQLLGKGPLNEGKKGGVQSEDDHRLLPHSADGRYPHLDMTRILCVWFVAIDHGNRTLGMWNVLFGQNWVLQWLFMVSGVAFALSTKKFLPYMGRLGVYFVIGVTINWMAWIIDGKDWSHDFFNVVFQFWFIVGLVQYFVFLAPLNWYMRYTKERDPDAAASGPSPIQHPLQQSTVLKLVCLVLAVLAFAKTGKWVLHLLAPRCWHFWKQFGEGASYWGLPQTPEESEFFMREVFSYFGVTFGNAIIAIFFPKFTGNYHAVGWLLLCNTYLHRMFFYRAAVERWFHFMDLTMIAVTIQNYGLSYRRQVGAVVMKYWFVWLFACALIWPCGLHGRVDEDPPKDPEIRFRVNLLEGIITTAWFVAGDRLLDPKMFAAEHHMDVLGEWALLTYLTHKAIHVLIPAPMNWVAILGLLPLIYLKNQKQSKEKMDMPLHA